MRRTRLLPQLPKNELFWGATIGSAAGIAPWTSTDRLTSKDMGGALT